MTNVADRRKLQALYPEPKARSGMAARKPTNFTIPIFRLFFLLFIPPFAVTALASLYLFGTGTDRVGPTWYFAIFVTCLILLVLLSVSLLSRAHTLLSRNCRWPLLVEGVYYALVPFTAWALINWLLQWSLGLTVMHTIASEAAIFCLLALSVALLGKQLSR